MRFHIIGTAHELQKASNPDTSVRDLLQECINVRNVALIAEEAEQKVLTFGQELIGADNWLSIDMPAEEQKKSGIYQTLNDRADRELGFDGYYRVTPYLYSSDGQRENFWLDRIEGRCREKGFANDVTVLITCGLQHAPFLAEKAFLRGHTVSWEECFPGNKKAQYGVFRIDKD